MDWSWIFEMWAVLLNYSLLYESHDYLMRILDWRNKRTHLLYIFYMYVLYIYTFYTFILSAFILSWCWYIHVCHWPWKTFLCQKNHFLSIDREWCMDLANIKPLKHVIATKKCLYHPLYTKMKKITLRFTCEIHLGGSTVYVQLWKFY